jgi:hypothetical protein
VSLLGFKAEEPDLKNGDKNISMGCVKLEQVF